MTRLGIIGMALAGALALPASAGAQMNGSDCSYAHPEGERPEATAYTADQSTGGGTTGTATLAAGVCVNAPTPGGTVQGGVVEIGVGNGTQSYAVVDGDNQNADPLDGYAGVSNYETGTPDGDCANGPDQGTPGSSNSGECFGFDGGPWIDLGFLPVPRPICGNTSGSTWTSSPRDGFEHSCFLFDLGSRGASHAAPVRRS